MRKILLENKFIYFFIIKFLLLFSNCAGDSCETDERACSRKPCQNGGNCSEVIRPGRENGFLCNCSKPFYSGLRCEIKFNVCWNQTCNYNGKCFNNASMFDLLFFILILRNNTLFSCLSYRK